MRRFLLPSLALALFSATITDLQAGDLPGEAAVGVSAFDEPGGDSGGEADAAVGTRRVELGAIPPEVVQAAADARHLPLAERLKAVTQPFLDAPYVSDGLGEGRGIDPDPLARYDVFDCLTFVEEALALALAGDPEHAADVRLDLRYLDRQVDYAHRKHFMELQWIPDAVARGWIRDTTTEYGETRRLEADVTLARWKAWGRRSLFKLAEDELPVGHMQLDVLSIDAALAAVDRIRPGSIVLTVREPRDWVPIWVTHLGFTVPGEDKPTVRHASRMSKSMRVRDHGLAWYLDLLKTYKHWKVAGVAILEPIDTLPRRATP